MAYLDTSVIVTLTIQEPRWLVLADWIAREQPTPIFSDFGWGECVSAVGLKVRRGDIDDADGRRSIQFREATKRLDAPSRPLGRARSSRTMIETFHLGLRYPDAIHIAAALGDDCVLVSADRRQIAAARHFPCTAINPIEVLHDQM